MAGRQHKEDKPLTTPASRDERPVDEQGFGRAKTRRWQRIVVTLLSRSSVALQRMPREKALRWGTRIAALAYRFGKRQRVYAQRNLRIAQFPTSNTTDAERDALIRRVFLHFAKMAVDFLRSPVMTDKDLSRLVRAENWHYMEEAMAGGRGVILLTAHFGNWEMLGRYMVSRGAHLTVIAREPEDPAFGKFVRDIRQSAGFKVKDKGNAAREVLLALKQGDVVGILPDQNSGDLFAPFFGVPAGTPAGPALFALRTGAPIIPSYTVRLPDDTYLARFFPPIQAEITGDRSADTQRIMVEANQRLEEMIREYPDQWLWLHNRWKSAFEKKNQARAWSEGIDTEEYREAWNRWSNAPVNEKN
ncbi:MAG: lysophospholipid acyltransferase family protein [Armatimonadota bacterium]